MDYLPVAYFFSGVFIGLIPFLFLMTKMPKSLIASFFKCNPSKEVIALIRPHNRFSILKRFKDALILEMDNIKYFFYPAKIELLEGKIPFLELHLSEAYVIPADVKNELLKLSEMIGEYNTMKFINSILEMKKLEAELEEAEDEEEKERISKKLDEVRQFINHIVENYKIKIDFNKISKSYSINQVDYDKLVNYFLEISPTTTYYYAEDLAYALHKKYGTDRWFWIVSIIAILIGGAVAWKLIGG